MRSLLTSALAATLACTPFMLFAQAPDKDLTPVMTTRGKLVCTEDFAAENLPPEWKVAKGTWTVVDGALRGVELPADNHAAVIRRPLDLQNAMVQFAFRFDGGKTVHLSLNDAKGHVCRVTITPTGFELKKDKPSKNSTEAPASIAKRDLALEKGRWYTMLVEFSGDEMLAQIDDAHHAFGSQPGIGRAKNNLGFPVSGDSVSVDRLRVWEATPNPDWASEKAKLAGK